MPKLGLGNASYIISWVESGILVQTRFEAAVLLVLLSFDANLGTVEDSLDIIVKILHPFTTTNFITSNA